MSEEKEESVMSATKKAIIGAITTVVTAGGAWFATQIGGEKHDKHDKHEESKEVKAEQPATPVIINVQQNQENKQQVKQGGGTNTIIKERVIEKPVAAPATKPQADEEPW